MPPIRAITRAVGASLADCELTFLGRQPIDLIAAAAQHAAYCAALQRAGAAVEVLPADDRLADATFVEDAAVVLDEVAVLARFPRASRRDEVAAVAAALAPHRRLLHLREPATLEGGDVLRLDRRCFVGRSSRSNGDGFAQFAAIAGDLGHRAVAVAVHGCLHLKTAVTALDQDTVLINLRWVDASAFTGLRQLAVPAHEPFAANALALGGAIHVSSRWRDTRRLLEQHGFATRPLEITEFEKAEAGLTCLSLLFAD